MKTSIVMHFSDLKEFCKENTYIRCRCETTKEYYEGILLYAPEHLNGYLVTYISYCENSLAILLG